MKTQILPILERELERYKLQKEALMKQIYPEGQTENKEMLLNFYSEKIVEFEAQINVERSKNNSFRGTIVQANAS